VSPDSQFENPAARNEQNWLPANILPPPAAGRAAIDPNSQNASTSRQRIGFVRQTSQPPCQPAVPAPVFDTIRHFRHPRYIGCALIRPGGSGFLECRCNAVQPNVTQIEKTGPSQQALPPSAHLNPHGQPPNMPISFAQMRPGPSAQSRSNFNLNHAQPMKITKQSQTMRVSRYPQMGALHES